MILTIALFLLGVGVLVALVLTESDSNAPLGAKERGW